MNNSPWKELYEKMGRNFPKNETERHVLKMLKEGEGLSDCLEYWESAGNSGKNFIEFMKRADEWETEELSMIGHYIR
ncbi:MAG: hypothetical protein K6F00_06460 [Lachnospiraceae bacterium]|nr:hypothetical protein [Lachnospiraceae bacterium]